MQYLKAYIEGLRWTTNPANKADAVKLVVERLKLPEDVATQAFERYSDPTEGF